MDSMIVIATVGGLIVGGLAASLVWQQRTKQTLATHTAAAQQTLAAEQAARQADAHAHALALQATDTQLQHAQAQLVAIQTELQQERQHSQQQLHHQTERLEALLTTRSALETEVTQLRERLSTQTEQWQQQFEAFLLTQSETLKTSLAQKAKEDYETNHTHLQTRVTELLKPLNDTLKAYQTRVETVDQAHHTGSALIRQELERLNGISTRLTQALSSNKGRGDWGEVQLIRLLEDSGLMEGPGYERQLPLANGKKRPDIIVKLPQDRAIFIDSKAIQVLTHVDADLPDEQRRQAVLNSLKTAIKDLGSKQYQAELTHAADFVVLYVPLESMLSEALTAEPELFQWARRQGVMLASPLNMMAMLQLVQQSWQLAKLSDDAHTIVDMGKQLYKQVSTAHARLEKLGRAVQTLDNAYVEVFTAMAGQQGMFKKVKQLEAYGCDQGKPFADEVFLPDKLATHPALTSDVDDEIGIHLVSSQP